LRFENSLAWDHQKMKLINLYQELFEVIKSNKSA